MSGSAHAPSGWKPALGAPQEFPIPHSSLRLTDTPHTAVSSNRKADTSAVSANIHEDSVGNSRNKLQYARRPSGFSLFTACFPNVSRKPSGIGACFADGCGNFVPLIAAGWPNDMSMPIDPENTTRA